MLSRACWASPAPPGAGSAPSVWRPAGKDPGDAAEVWASTARCLSPMCTISTDPYDEEGAMAPRGGSWRRATIRLVRGPSAAHAGPRLIRRPRYAPSAAWRQVKGWLAAAIGWLPCSSLSSSGPSGSTGSMGKVGTGLLKLLTAGGFGIWWLVDVILIATGAMRDAEGRELVPS